MTTPPTQPLDEWVFLSGRPHMGEYLGFVTSNAANPSAVDIAALSNEWRAANVHVQQLEINEAGWADNPTIGGVPAALQSLADQVVADPMFQKAFQIAPATIGIVELDRLVVFQKHINLTYTNELKTRLG